MTMRMGAFEKPGQVAVGQKHFLELREKPDSEGGNAGDFSGRSVGAKR
jgi:hypothetical protein